MTRRPDHRKPEVATGRTVADEPAVRAEATSVAPLAVPPMRYPNSYVWFVFVSAMDVMLTWQILSKGGMEVNPVARVVIDFWGLFGALAFKFSLMLFVILVCEAAGRKKDTMGRWLAYTAIAVSSLPVVYSLALLTYNAFGSPVLETP